jgi:Amidohydrolase
MDGNLSGDRSDISKVSAECYKKSMIRICLFLCSVLSAFLFALLVSAQDLPIFDAHIHYNQPDWSVYSPDAIMKLFNRAGVRWAMVSSTPDEGTLRLYNKAPARIVPLLRPYRTDKDRASWTEDLSILSYVETRLEKGIYQGIGEFHLSALQADSIVLRRFAELAKKKGILLHAHTDEKGIERLLRLYTGVRILLAHAGMSSSAETLSRLIGQYSMLSVELAIRDDVAPGGHLAPGWRELFLQFPDRFMVGSDPWITSRWESLPEIHGTIRAWLNELPRDVAEKIAYQNAMRLVGKK